MKAWIAAIFVVLFAATAQAQGDAGTQSPFAAGAGNRALGLGGAYSAIANDASAVLWNPGGLGLVRHRELQATTTSYFGLGINEQFASIVLPNYRWGAASFTLRHFGVSNIEERDDRNVVLGSDLSDTQVEVALGYGRRVSPAWSFGGTVKMLRHSVAGYKDSDLGLDLGVIVHPVYLFAPNSRGAERLTLGLAWRNVIEPKLRLESERVADPGGLRFGVGYWAPFLERRPILIAVDLEKTSDVDARVHAGAEIRLHPQLALRSGIADGVFTAGTSIAWRDVAIDYALENNNVDPVHRLGITLTFGPSVEQQEANAIAERDRVLQDRLLEAFEYAQDARTTSLLAQARTKRDSKDYDGAIETLAILHALAPDNEKANSMASQCWRERARGLERDGNHAEAIVSYRRALSLRPGDLEAQRGLEQARAASDDKAARSEAIRQQFAAGMDAFSRDDLVEARDAFTGILAADPGDIEASQMHARTLRAIEVRRDDLVRQCRRALAAGQANDARTLIERMRLLDPAASVLPELTGSLDALVRTESDARSSATSRAAAASKTSVHSVSKADRAEADRLFQRGVHAMEAERTDDGLRYFELAYRLDPGHQVLSDYLKRAYLQRGIVAFSNGELDEAVEFWGKVLDIDPSDEKAKGYLKRAREQMRRTREILGE